MATDTQEVTYKVSFLDLKTILFYFPAKIWFKADPEIFFRYFKPYSNEPKPTELEKRDLKRRLNNLAEKEHCVLTRTEFTDVYFINPDFKDSFIPTCTEEKRLILEDIAHEIWIDLEQNDLTL